MKDFIKLKTWGEILHLSNYKNRGCLKMTTLINLILKFNANEGSMGLYVRRLLVLLRKTKVDFY